MCLILRLLGSLPLCLSSVSLPLGLSVVLPPLTCTQSAADFRPKIRVFCKAESWHHPIRTPAMDDGGGGGGVRVRVSVSE